jgi:CubicO group peptidase (beta-lactamase class C family)
MSKIISSLLTFVLISILFLTSCQTKDSTIKKVENGLLPVVLIEGEPSFKLEDRMKYYKVPGISIAVIKDYKLEWTKQYGVMDSEIKNPVTDSTVFNIGSLSKGVAALTVLGLAEEGKIDINKDVNAQLKSWKIPENEFTKKAIVTPLLLMNHSGGAMFSPPFSYLPENLPTLLQVLKGDSLARSRSVVIDKIPGTEFQYSNVGFSILQQLTIDTEQKSFPEITNEKIFQPLDMNNSTFQQPLPANFLKHASAGHKIDGIPLEVKRYVYPHMAAGGLWTTTEDYAKYVTELQKSYLGKSNKIISQKLAKEMLSPHVSKQYGLGVFMREIDGEINYFGHMGDNRGFFAGYISHLTDGHGAIVFTNSQNGSRLIREITNGIAKVYDWKGYLPKEYKLVDIDYKMLDNYVGRYRLGSDNSFEITKENGNLFINRFDTAQLYFIGEEKFVTKYRKGYLQFKSDTNQNISSGEYHFADELGRFLFEPQKCYKMKNSEKLPLELLEEGKISESIKLYRKIKKENPKDLAISENRFNHLGYKYMGQKKYEQAVAILKLNIEFYPESANCYDSLAEAFLKNGNKKLAIKNYKKSLELNPNNNNAKTMLNKLIPH